jgi:hypothetical protein
MLLATLDHHIPRSASLIESSGASEDEAISVTKNPARELALMNAIGLLPALMDLRMPKADLNWYGRCLIRQRRIGTRQRPIGSQRWDAQTGLPPIGARIVREAGCERATDVKLE